MRPSTLLRLAALTLLIAALSCDRSRPFEPAALVTMPRAHDGAAMPIVVISQVYGGGGNVGAVYKNDFVELYNRGDATATLDGWSVQYASATGTGFFSGNSPVTLSGTLAPGQYYLVQLAGGSNGVALPTPDRTGTINMSAGSGKIILANTATGLACNGGSTPCSAAQLAQIVDLVGYGSANFYEGAAAPTLANGIAALRHGAGCVDTDNNAADFTAATPTPRNSASATHTCEGGPAVRLKISPATAQVSVGATTTFAAEAKDADSIVVYPALTWESLDPTIATVSAGGVAKGLALGSTRIAVSSGALADTADVTVTPPEIRYIAVSSSSTDMPPGFQTQLFATALTGPGGDTVDATFSFEAVDPTRLTVVQVGNTAIVTGVAPTDAVNKGGVKITATPVEAGTPSYSFTTYSIRIVEPVTAPASIYGVNDEFGDPAAASGSDPDNLLIVRPQYTISYSESHGTPNWVSYELDTRQLGNQDRCNCFTADPLLPAEKQILTSDYTNGGYDRGHMTKSADRTAANVDNAATFYLTNIVPQMADLNQGPWASFENAISDSADAGRAVYVVTGPLYSRSHGLTFLKNEGKVAIPDSTWKVAFIGPVAGGLPFDRGDIETWTDLAGVTVLAVNMPNVSGIRNVPWQTYLTTVDRIETATGYDILSLLQAAFQTALEASDHGPAAAFSYSGTLLGRSPLTFDASTTTDPDLGRTDMDGTEALTYAWTFGDGSTAVGVTPVKTYTLGGTYTVTLTATDAWGWPSTATHTVTVLTPLQGITVLGNLIAPLGGNGGPLGAGELNSLQVKLRAAEAACGRSTAEACSGAVGAFVNELQALVNSGRVDAALVAPIISYAERVVVGLGI